MIFFPRGIMVGYYVAEIEFVTPFCRYEDFIESNHEAKTVLFCIIEFYRATINRIFWYGKRITIFLKRILYFKISRRLNMI